MDLRLLLPSLIPSSQSVSYLFVPFWFNVALINSYLGLRAGVLLRLLGRRWRNPPRKINQRLVLSDGSQLRYRCNGYFIFFYSWSFSWEIIWAQKIIFRSIRHCWLLYRESLQKLGSVSPLVSLYTHYLIIIKKKRCTLCFYESEWYSFLLIRLLLIEDLSYSLLNLIFCVLVKIVSSLLWFFVWILFLLPQYIRFVPLSLLICFLIFSGDICVIYYYWAQFLG